MYAAHAKGSTGGAQAAGWATRCCAEPASYLTSEHTRRSRTDDTTRGNHHIPMEHGSCCLRGRGWACGGHPGLLLECVRTATAARSMAVRMIMATPPGVTNLQL